ncbi:MAG: RNA-binding protein [Candidatus Krumholzibacteria bacterium]|nr:RNA-binding protein [Candidatus Krumholzibacteria bacterium]MDH4336913.1 RNA-binding protein [Candidatus Krumholzibacteria bacterium]MDH5269791.1 RNA-binding protein [Candidatus Krumholzibacteria bacterium]MDH5627732.1 RNA-binding protein [Candidatus Krumholzibacteria bacterium]
MSTKRMYVGNLSFDSTTEDVSAAFGAFGTVIDCSLISDRATGRTKGFGFVEMDATEAANAMAQLNGKDLGGRAITVAEARERTSGTPSN